MHHLTLWLNMITFSVLVASGGLSFLRFLRIRAAWQKFYLAYLGSYAAWLLISTYTLFQRVYLFSPVQFVETLFAYARIAVSVVLVIVGPIAFVMVGRQFASTRRRRAGRISREWIVVWTVAAAILVLIVLMLATERPIYSFIATYLFNSYFALLAIRALLMVAGSTAGRDEPIRTFLWYSAIAHPLTILASVTLRHSMSPDRFFFANVFAIGVFCLLWGVVMIVADMRRILAAPGDSDQLPSDLIQAMRLTAREAEVVRTLVEGITSKDAAERLFISQRTVETHIRNVYRKCGVANRVELVRLVAKYRAG